jgi:hypothetical protein
MKRAHQRRKRAKRRARYRHRVWENRNKPWTIEVVMGPDYCSPDVVDALAYMLESQKKPGC